MSAQSWDYSGYERLRQRLARLQDPDCSPLMEEWEKVIVEDNRRGVLAGLDKDDQPMPDLKYRGWKDTKAPPKRARGKKIFGTTTYAPNTGGGANLSTSEYQRLIGPRLAPQFEASRIIANLHTGHGRDPADKHRWFAVGAWLDVVSRDGHAFLVDHFTGAGRLPQYDLRGVRAWGVEEATKRLRTFVDKLLKGR